MVVILDPFRDAFAVVFEAVEQSLFEKLIPHSVVERLAEPVQNRLARRNEVPGDAVILNPGQHRLRGELGAIVRDNPVGNGGAV